MRYKTINPVVLLDIGASEILRHWFRLQSETDSIKIIKKLIKEGYYYYADFLIMHLMRNEELDAYSTYKEKQPLKIVKHGLKLLEEEK